MTTSLLTGTGDVWRIVAPCELESVYLAAQRGEVAHAVVDVFMATADQPLEAGVSICGTNKPTLDGQWEKYDGDLTGWTKVIPHGARLWAELEAGATGASRLNLTLQRRRT